MKNQFGLTEKQFKFLNENLIEPLKKQGAEVYIFGSRANGKYKKFSDIDLFYTQPLSGPISEGKIYQWLSRIEESDFPFKIDLALYDNLAASYLPSIEKEKIKL